MYVGSCKQRYETNLVPSQSNKATIRICFQSSTSLSDLCLTPFCSPLYPHLDSDLSDLPCSAAAAVLPQRALASKQLARELWPVHRKKPSLTPLGLDGLWDGGRRGGGPDIQAAGFFWVTGDARCSETRRPRWTHPCHQPVLPEEGGMLEGKAEWLEPLIIGRRWSADDSTHTHTPLKVCAHVPKRKVERTFAQSWM